MRFLKIVAWLARWVFVLSELMRWPWLRFWRCGCRRCSTFNWPTLARIWTGVHHRLIHMVVVFGGVGNLWGTLVAGLSPGLFNKIWTMGWCGSRQDSGTGFHHSIYSKAPTRTVPATWSCGWRLRTTSCSQNHLYFRRCVVTKVANWPSLPFLRPLALIPLANTMLPSGHPLHVETLPFCLNG